MLELRVSPRRFLKLKWCPKDDNISKLFLWFFTMQQKILAPKVAFSKEFSLDILIEKNRLLEVSIFT